MNYDCRRSQCKDLECNQGRTDHLEPGHCPRARDAPGTFFIGFFEFGQGHRGPMIPYCPG
ncbi:unnamed protein product, partial [Staurois parvus]